MILRILGTYHFLIGLITLVIQLSYIWHQHMDVDVLMVSLSFLFLFAGFKTFTKKRIGVILLIFLNLLQMLNVFWDNNFYNFNFGLVQFYDFNYNEIYFYSSFSIKNLPAIRDYYPCIISAGNPNYIRLNLMSLYIILFLLFGYTKIATKEDQPWEIDFQK